MNAAAAAAADFKSSFTPQFNGLMQPFGAAAAAADEAALYAAGYAPPSYNSWAGKVPSPLAGTAKSFPWGLNSVNMSPLGAAGFNPVPPVGQMVNTMATMSNSLGMASQSAAGPCMQHYSNPANHYASYRDQCAPPPPPPPAVTPSSVQTPTSSAGLRFNVKAPNNNSSSLASNKTSSGSSSSSSTSSSSGSNSSAGLLSVYGQPPSPRSSASALTACQYAGADRSPV